MRKFDSKCLFVSTVVLVDFLMIHNIPLVSCMLNSCNWIPRLWREGPTAAICLNGCIQFMHWVCIMFVCGCRGVVLTSYATSLSEFAWIIFSYEETASIGSNHQIFMLIYFSLERIYSSTLWHLAAFWLVGTTLLKSRISFNILTCLLTFSLSRSLVSFGCP